MYLLNNKKEECSGCTACVNKCPKGAIEMREDSEGFLYPYINKELCNNCGLCKEICKKEKKNINNVIESYGVKLKNIEERRKSSSGGAFIAISDFILKQNGIIYGAAFDENFNVVHKRAISKEQRDEFQKSKYVQSDLKNIFKQVKEDLINQHTILFTGTPCQVDGLIKFLGDINIEKLFTCDLICHGVPSPKVYKDYLLFISDGNVKKIKEFNFRNKKYGWGSHYETYLINKQNEKTDLKYKELFYSNLILRPSCYECKYTNLNRIADITLGDFWGIEKINNDFRDKEGVSLVIINSQKGKIIFEEIKNDIDYINVNINDALQHNLIKPTERPDNRDSFWNDYNRQIFKRILKKYVPKIYDKNVNKCKWLVYKTCKKIKTIISKQEMKK